MAHIHGTSGSTKYLLNGTRPINGKKPASLKEIRHLLSHYDEILAGVETAAARRHDEILFALGNDEAVLGKELNENISRRTAEVDAGIGELNRKMIDPASGLLTRSGYRIRYWIAVSMRNHRIHSPFRNAAMDLNNLRNRKADHIRNRSRTIRQERYNVTGSYEFLKQNESFLIGAEGEEVVINALSRLPDEFHVLNDVNLRFDRAIHWWKHDEYIRTCQIDHIVAGPTGIFLLETKNWKSPDIEIKSDKLIHQVQRSALALWYFTKDYYWMDKQPKIRSIVVSLKGTASGRRLDKYIDVVTPGWLCNYITRRETILSEEAVKKFVDIISKKRPVRSIF